MRVVQIWQPVTGLQILRTITLEPISRNNPKLNNPKPMNLEAANR